MADNALLKELRKARKGNNLEADPATVLIEVIEELIKLRKDLDAAELKIAALEGVAKIPIKVITEPVKAIEEM